MKQAPKAFTDRRRRSEVVDEGLEFAGLALSINSLMAAFKIIVGLFSGSHALLASALYSINDVLSSVAVTVSLRLGLRKPDPKYAYGYDKAEFIAVAIVSVSIAVGVFFMFFFSVIDILRGVPGPPHFAALTLAGLSLVVSWFLSKKGHHIADKLESPAVATSADHHHADAEGSLLAIIGIVGAVLGFHVLDRIIAIIETLHIVALSGTLLGKSLKGLMDTSLPEEEVALVRDACLKVAGVERVAHVWSRRTGSKTWIDVAVAVPSTYDVSRAHAVVDDVQGAVRGILGPGAFAQVRFQGAALVERRPGPGGSPHG